MIQTIADIQQLAVNAFSDWQAEGAVTVREKDDLLIFNYTAAAQYAKSWNFFERVSRGLIINRNTGEVVARPFDKFFNWGERGHKAHGHIVGVYEKLDGSLGILYRHPQGDYRITTRGSFDSEQGAWATRFLHESFILDGLPTEYTLLFEIIYPENRIVVDYQGREDLVLLAVRNRFTGDYLPFYGDARSVYGVANEYGFSLPTVYNFNNATDIIAAAGALDETREGWVVEMSSGERWKFKGDRYLELHKILYGLSFKQALKAVEQGTVQSIRDQVPDGFLTQFNEWVTEIDTRVRQVKQQVAMAYHHAPKGSRKEFALWVREQHPDLMGYLFAYLDGKPLEPLIYRKAFSDWDDDDDAADV